MGLFDNEKRKKNLIIAGTVVLFILTVFMYFRYSFVYSEGTRVGIIYKFSKKGTMFKTYEGTMMLPGIRSKGDGKSLSTNTFHFSVTDEDLAKRLMKRQGMEVEVHYVNYMGALPWRGDSYDTEDGQYIVDKLIRVKDKNPNGYGL